MDLKIPHHTCLPFIVILESPNNILRLFLYFKTFDMLGPNYIRHTTLMYIKGDSYKDKRRKGIT